MFRDSAAALPSVQVAPLFAALGDATRLALINRLSASGPQSITRLTAGTSITRQAITKHLTVLAAAGVVHDIRRGRERIWALEAERFDEARRYLALVSQQWDDALQRLKILVED
jgi:DNA-binding transcriptional ArsR family regulator